ncbi:permease [Vibrio owensii]|uniref:Permease n=3 Tax=Vibrio harveyi group TaxID=717610 RepID=A0AAP9GIR8_9VIBR|nr:MULTISPECIES: permease [Vibrio]KIP76610.1 membrane protein [Vibrio harveyi]AYO16676.1 permease [Vibrio owensii]AYO22643.1 permease [Vibrio owensii]EKM26991.1 putative permease family protein [Vibrio sp. HENC-03]MDA0381567.1 permease [Vibrio owensii]
MNPEIMTMAKEALDMFAFLATELIILFLAISYIVGVLQDFLTPEKIQSILSSKKGKGYFIAALLGSITPFCSCSTIPFLKGLLRARAGFGPMMVFLFASPLLNPVIIGLFVVTFGWKVAVFYFAIAMTVSVVAGYVLEKLGFERYVKPEAYEAAGTSSCGTSCGDSSKKKEQAKPASSCGTSTCGEPAPVAAKTSCCSEPAPVVAKTSCCGDSAPKAEPKVEVSCCSSDGSATATIVEEKEPSRWVRIWHSTWKDFKQVFPYLMMGIAIGSFIYGFIPTDLIAEYAGEAKWYAIPVAAIIGIPLYIRAEAVIPLSAALVQKGMALGSVMALIIGSAGASLTEVILLKSIFKNQMIAAFLFVILTMAMGAGYLYTFIFA